MKQLFKRPVTWVTVIACMVILLVVGRQMFWEGNPQTLPSFSVVVYGSSTQRWNAFDQGVRQACSDFGYAKPMINIPGMKADYKGQMQLIEREINNGAQGVIVTCEDSENLQPYFDKISNKTAVVTVLNGVGDQSSIEPNYVDLGRELGERALETGGKNILVIDHHMGRNSVKKSFAALIERLEESDVDVTIHSLTDMEGLETRALYSLLEKTACDTLIALDNETLEAALTAKENLSSPINLYGVGNSEKIIHALDKGMIQGICFINEYDAGYLSVLQMAEKLGIRTLSFPREIQFLCVTQEELYHQENERIIFPFY